MWGVGAASSLAHYTMAPALHIFFLSKNRLYLPEISYHLFNYPVFLIQCKVWKGLSFHFSSGEEEVGLGSDQGRGCFLHRLFFCCVLAVRAVVPQHQRAWQDVKLCSLAH